MEFEARWVKLKEAAHIAGIGRNKMLGWCQRGRVIAKKDHTWSVWLPSLAPGWQGLPPSEEDEAGKFAIQQEIVALQTQKVKLTLECEIKELNAKIGGIVDKAALEEFRKKKEAVDQTEQEQTKQWAEISDTRTDLREEREAFDQRLELMKGWMPKFDEVKVWVAECSEIIVNHPAYENDRLKLPKYPLHKMEVRQINEWLEEEQERKANPPKKEVEQPGDNLFAEEESEGD